MVSTVRFNKVLAAVQDHVPDEEWPMVKYKIRKALGYDKKHVQELQLRRKKREEVCKMMRDVRIKRMPDVTVAAKTPPAPGASAPQSDEDLELDDPELDDLGLDTDTGVHARAQRAAREAPRASGARPDSRRASEAAGKSQSA